MKRAELLKFQRNKARLCWSTERWGWGGQGLKDVEAKGGNATTEIQTVLSWIEGNCTITVESTLCQHGFQVLQCWMQATFQNIISNLCRPLHATLLSISSHPTSVHFGPSVSPGAVKPRAYCSSLLWAESLQPWKPYSVSECLIANLELF